MQSGLTILLCVGAAIVYGIIHDNITARICVEYFTVGHDPNVIPTTNPTLLALGWGILATWWVGLFLGIAVSIAARAGSRPKRSVRSLVRPVIYLMVTSAFFALVAGVIGFILAKNKVVTLPPHLAENIAPHKHAAFLACFFAHNASYWVGFMGGGIQIAIIWLSRRWLKPAKSRP